MKIKILFLMLYCSNHYANQDKNRIKLIEEFKSCQQSLRDTPESFLNLYTSRSILSTIIFLKQTKSFETIPSSDLLIHENILPKIKSIPQDYKEFKKEFESLQDDLKYIPEYFLNLYANQSILDTIALLKKTKSFKSISPSDLLIYKNTFSKIKLIPKNYREFKEEESKLYKAYVALKEKDLELINSLYSDLEHVRYTITEEIANFELLKKEAYNSKKFITLQPRPDELDEFAGLIQLYHRYYEHNPYHLECVKPFSGYISDQSSDDEDPFARFNISTTGISDPKEKRVTFNLTQPYCEIFDCSHS